MRQRSGLGEFPRALRRGTVQKTNDKPWSRDNPTATLELELSTQWEHIRDSE
eukprot:CAMPEP_0176094156 /NCGR_PEP_ID=MMETSP0120_2-20121206/47183_1 /TAXON_ID=160619 /ORGANISM="Kryptoperidinium foliaceum, Strain CCMP 1326" /LENGTH=51 /DNA_ID=CAMNT_0017428099 /DNA_START=133 /DNA_END=285 /DNA_ORIENTATION=-